MGMISDSGRDAETGPVRRKQGERDMTGIAKQGDGLTNRLSNPDSNPPLKGHTPVSSIVLES